MTVPECVFEPSCAAINKRESFHWTQKEEKKKRRRTSGGIVAGGCCASRLFFSLWPCSARKGKVGSTPPPPCLSVFLTYLFTIPLCFLHSCPSPLRHPSSLCPTILPSSPHSIALLISLSIYHDTPSLSFPFLPARCTATVVWSEFSLRFDASRQQSVLTDNLLVFRNIKSADIYLLLSVIHSYVSRLRELCRKYIRGGRITNPNFIKLEKHSVNTSTKVPHSQVSS